MQVCTASHEIFVPREIVFEICSTPEHLAHWHEALNQAQLITCEPPEHLVFQLTNSSDAPPAEVTIRFKDLGGTTRIDVEQKGQFSVTQQMHLDDEWQASFARMENYLSAI